MASLLVSTSAPPRPSICRTSGLPKISSTYLSRKTGSLGSSFSRMKMPLLVPPRTMEHFTLITSDFMALVLSAYFVMWVPLSPRRAAAAFSRLAMMAVPPALAKDMAACTLGSILPGAKWPSPQ